MPGSTGGCGSCTSHWTKARAPPPSSSAEDRRPKTLQKILTYTSSIHRKIRLGGYRRSPRTEANSRAVERIPRTEATPLAEERISEAEGFPAPRVPALGAGSAVRPPSCRHLPCSDPPSMSMVPRQIPLVLREYRRPPLALKSKIFFSNTNK